MADGLVGTEDSKAGKIRRRSGSKQKTWIDAMTGKDYLGKQHNYNYT